MATPKTTLEDIQSRFPVGRMIEFDAGRGATVRAKVTGHRESGVKGERGYSLFIDTVEDRGDKLKPIKRSARPGTCVLVD